MADAGMGEPLVNGQTDLPAEPRPPEPQPEIPTDPLLGPEDADPARDPIRGPGLAPEMPGEEEATPEMPGDTGTRPEIPYESGISDIPAPATAGAADTARKRGARMAKAAGGAGTAAPPAVVAPATGPVTPGATDKARKCSGGGRAAADESPKPRSGRSGRPKAGGAAEA